MNAVSKFLFIGALGVSPLYAGLTLIDLFKNISYNQTSGAPPVTPSFFFADVEVTMQNPGDFDTVTVTYPGLGSPLSLPLVAPTKFGVGPAFATQADMNAAFPFGTYTYTAVNSGTSNMETASLSYTQDAFTADIPALTAATFAALQNMNAGLPFTFNFNSFTPHPNATFGETFLTIFGSPFSVGIPNTATSATVPANTLLPGTTYTAELDFSDRLTGQDQATGVPTLIGFDVRTDVTFTTAATTATPEPSTTLLLGIGLIAAARLGPSRRQVRNGRRQ